MKVKGKPNLPPKSEESSEMESDDSEDDSEETSEISKQTVNDLRKKLTSKSKRSVKIIIEAAKKFHLCVQQISEPDGFSKIKGSDAFNEVIRLCVCELYPSVIRIFNLSSKSISKNDVSTSKKWPLLKNCIRQYITDLTKLIDSVTSEDTLRVLLKHLHQMVPFAACLPTISKPFLKIVISCWGTSSDDTVRVIAFLCLLRYVVCDPTSYLHTALKKMYVSYVSNSKFVSPNSIAAINFMRKSLAEMFTLSETVAYHQAFLYIRQLAIHLRSAVTLKQKDSVQAVYNWQFMSSLRLWVDVLSAMQEKQQMQSLIYPTIQIIIGCIKLIPTAQYLPLRFHCVEMLITFTKEIGIYIPVLPFLIEALSILKVNDHHKKMSMKPMDFTYILRLSKAQLQENAFKDAVIENVYDCLLQYTAFESHRISFPEIVTVLQIHLKQFCKECKNANYTRKFKPLLDKIKEAAQLITSSRNGISLVDAKGIAAYEAKMKTNSNTLMKFYDDWAKMQEQKGVHKTSDKIEIFDQKLPELRVKKKKKKPKKTKAEEVEKNVECPPKKRKLTEKEDVEMEDEVENFNLKEFLK